MKKVFTLLTLLLAVCSGAWAAVPDFTYSIGETANATTLAANGSTYSTTTASSATAIKNKTLWVEVPSASSAGYISFFGNGNNSERHIYIHKTNGTVKDETRAITMVSGWNTEDNAILFSADDILTNGEKYYLVFSSGSEDYKFKAIKYTILTNAAFITQPVGNTYLSGDPIEPLTVSAVASSGVLSYQWYVCEDAEKKNATAIDGATNASFTPSGAGFYFCRITDTNGSVDSNVVEIEISAATAPTISIVATATSVYKTQNVTLNATMTGVPSPTIQWYSNTIASNEGGEAIDGATTETYLPSTESVGTFYYYAVASNGISPNAISNVITLTVTSPDVDRTGYNTYYIAKDELPIPNERIFCDDITMTFVNGKAGETFVAGIEDLHLKDFNAKYEASISASSGNNGWSTKFAPTANGTLSVGVIINNNKTFTVTNVTSFSYEGRNNASTPSNVSATIDGNSFTTGASTDDKLYVIVTLSVEKDKEYSLSVAGSKMGFFGFEFTPTPANVPVTLATSGKSTFASQYALDCANLPTGLKAYKVSAVSAKSATLTEVTEAVAAGTGLILIGTGSASYDIPVAATGTDISASNELVGVTADKALTAGEAFLLSNGTFVPCKAGTLKAGKAYLPNTSGARSLSLVFEGEATGINAIENAETINGIYNLNGQRVAQPTRGLYIMNGKKIIVK